MKIYGSGYHLVVASTVDGDRPAAGLERQRLALGVVEVGDEVGHHGSAPVEGDGLPSFTFLKGGVPQCFQAVAMDENGDGGER